MRAYRPLRSFVTCCLLAVLTALGTGLPSHHHGNAMTGVDETRMLSSDHHTHAAQLVEQDDRVPSFGVDVAVSGSVGFDPPTGSEILTEPLPDELPRPQERAPPPGAPRAPPHRA